MISSVEIEKLSDSGSKEWFFTKISIKNCKTCKILLELYW
jgi:hypothetical protein